MNTFLPLLLAFIAIVLLSSSHHRVDAFSIAYIRPSMHSSSSQSMTMRKSASTTSIEATSSSSQVLERSSIITDNDTVIKESSQQQQQKHRQKHSEEQRNNEHDRYHLLLLNDAINTRSYVCRILVEVTALSEAESYARMVHAHEHGEAIIGEYCMEYAEHYKEALLNHGLLCEIIPVTE